MKSSPPETTITLTPQAIDALRRACKSKKTRAAAVRDPRAVLARNGINLSSEVELQLYEHKGGSAGTPRHAGHDVADPLLDVNVTLQAVPAGLDASWRSTHHGCPFPTVPYTTKKKVTVCDVWSVWAGPREWVLDGPGSPFGHWSYPNAQSVCVLSHEEEVDVTECLPPFITGPFRTRAPQ